ncbi:MAG TPA: hypothetical protein VF429_01990 [Anaerolineae bacterium]|jgi:hypothetical protein
MSDAVLDAGPLIHLAELDMLDVLRDLTPLYASDSVWAEVASHQPRALQSPELNLQHHATCALCRTGYTGARVWIGSRGN